MIPIFKYIKTPEYNNKQYGYYSRIHSLRPPGKPDQQDHGEYRAVQKIIFYPGRVFSNEKYCDKMHGQRPDYIYIISANIIYAPKPCISHYDTDQTQETKKNGVENQ
jgi:hypothetical protein